MTYLGSSAEYLEKVKGCRWDGEYNTHDSHNSGNREFHSGNTSQWYGKSENEDSPMCKATSLLTCWFFPFFPSSLRNSLTSTLREYIKPPQGLYMSVSWGSPSLSRSSREPYPLLIVIAIHGNSSNMLACLVSSGISHLQVAAQPTHRPRGLNCPIFS